MKIYRQVAILFGVCLAGQLVSVALPFPFPASVAAMLLLFFLFLSGALKLQCVKIVADFLLQNMAILFVPTIVTLLGIYTTVAPYVWSLLAVCIITTILTGLATAGVTVLVIGLQNKRKAREGKTGE